MCRESTSGIFAIIAEACFRAELLLPVLREIDGSELLNGYTHAELADKAATYERLATLDDDAMLAHLSGLRMPVQQNGGRA